MSEIIFEIIARSITLKATQEERRKKKRKALLSCTKKSKINETKDEEKKTKTRISLYQDFDGLWKSLEKNFCVIVLIGVRDVDWLINDWDEFDNRLFACSSVFVLSHESVVIVSVVDRQAIECGRREQSIGDEFIDDDEDFLW